MVTKPVTALTPDKLRKAPVEDMPVPKTVMASAMVIPPVNCNAAPLATVVPDAVEPNPDELVTDKVPELTVVAPV